MNNPAADSHHHVSVISNINDIADQYDAFILDIWGVLHDGLRPYPDTIDCLKKLKAAGKQTCLLSNTHHRTSLLIRKLTAMGITRDLYNHVLSAAESACLALRDRPDDGHKNLGTKCYLLDQDIYDDDTEKTDMILEGLNLEIHESPENASFIMNSCGAIPPEKLAPLNQKIDEALPYNIPMICLNPDLIVGIGDTEYPCGGAFAKRYEEQGGTVIYHGKPHKPIYEMAWTLLDKPEKKRIIAIGDSLHTDIQGANNFGIDSLFNLAGIHRKDIVQDNKLQTDMLAQLIFSQPHRPTAALDGFKW